MEPTGLRHSRTLLERGRYGTTPAGGPATTRLMTFFPGCAALGRKDRERYSTACGPKPAQMVERYRYAVGRGRNATNATLSPTTRYNPR
jgi:hypothetical protein